MKFSKFGAIGATLSGLAIQAHAAVPAAVTTALEGMQEDGLAVATAVLVATIVVAAFKFMKKGM
ncbi:MAG: hypothetical protein J0M00_01560 [Burkholderiales bacterium]|nr:hypothetical protein [Burkholderiales bacterium]